MLPTRCVQAVLFLSLALSATALVLGNRAILAGATAILVFIGWRGILFQQEFARLIREVTVSRVPATTLARQGSEISVATRVTWDRPLPFTCTVEDLVPPGSIVDDGESAQEVPAGSGGGITLRYRMQVLTHGTIPFVGIRLTTSDPFFRNGIMLGKDTFTRPELHIHPAGSFTGEGGGVGFGERESDQLRGLTSLTTRSFRLFQDGDSLKAVDWKLSAKHAKLYVREYAGLLGQPPVIVIDLPDRSMVLDTRPGEGDPFLHGQFPHHHLGPEPGGVPAHPAGHGQLDLGPGAAHPRGPAGPRVPGIGRDGDRVAADGLPGPGRRGPPAALLRGCRHLRRPPAADPRGLQGPRGQDRL
ncbi:MAG: DUF58 domain-containing protein [Methanomicrobiales archaeon]|nr:DUF58 domain-containing protein [Methanomicrobiales archaeon]